MLQERTLKVVLVLVGLFFLLGVYPLATSYREVNKWDGDEMMLSIYVALGVFLLFAARNPSANRSLIASFAHGAVTTLMAIKMPGERVGLLIAVGVLCAIGVALIALAPAKQTGEPASAAGA